MDKEKEKQTEQETKELVKALSDIVEIIQDALDKDAIGAAFFCSLAIPDICGQIEYPDLRGPRNVGERYRKWYKKNIYCYENPESVGDSDHKFPEKMNKIDEDVFYLIRCKMYHQGDGEHKVVLQKLLSKYKKEFNNKNVRLTFDTKSNYDGVSYGQIGNEKNMIIDVNLDRKRHAEILMWTAQVVLSDANQQVKSSEANREI